MKEKVRAAFLPDLGPVLRTLVYGAAVFTALIMFVLSTATTAHALSTDSSSDSCVPYINQYMKGGQANDPSEVVKLQSFLHDAEGYSSVASTGVFDQATYQAVLGFQMRYASDILAPWGYDAHAPTGYVYITTAHKINEIYCNTTYAFTQSELDEMSTYMGHYTGSQGGQIGESASPGTGADETGGSLSVVTPETPNTDTAEGKGMIDEGTTTASTTGAGILRSGVGSARNIAGSIFTIPGTITEIYNALLNLVLVLFIIAIMWLIAKGYVLYGDEVPTQKTLEHDRLRFFSTFSLIAAIVAVFFPMLHPTILPLVAIFVVLLAVSLRDGSVETKALTVPEGKEVAKVAKADEQKISPNKEKEKSVPQQPVNQQTPVQESVLHSEIKTDRSNKEKNLS